MFADVYCAKPKSCRNSSIEAFLVAKDFKGREQIGLKGEELNNWDILTTLNHISNFRQIYFEEKDEESDDDLPPVKFVACGDEDAFDPDMNYSLTEPTSKIEEFKGNDSDIKELKESSKQLYKYLKPRQAPINPPYLAYLQSQKRDQNILESQK